MFVCVCGKPCAVNTDTVVVVLAVSVVAFVHTLSTTRLDWAGLHMHHHPRSIDARRPNWACWLQSGVSMWPLPLMSIECLFLTGNKQVTGGLAGRG